MKTLNLETQLHLPAKIQQLGAKVIPISSDEFLSAVDEKKWHPKYTREQRVLVARTLSRVKQAGFTVNTKDFEGL